MLNLGFEDLKLFVTDRVRSTTGGYVFAGVCLIGDGGGRRGGWWMVSQPGLSPDWGGGYPILPDVGYPILPNEDTPIQS